MQVLIVGAGGFIGRHLDTALSGAGHNVVRLSSRNGSGIDPGSGVFRRAPAIPPGTDAVIYLAQSSRYRQVPEHAAHVLSVSTIAAVQAAAAAVGSGVRKFIYTSTGNVYEPSFEPYSESSPLRRDDWYALSKIQAEEALALFRDRMEVTIARLFGVYGPSQTGRLIPNLVEKVRAGRPILLEPNAAAPADRGGLRLSLCHVEDVARILVALISERLSVVNLSSDESLSMEQIAGQIGTLLGRFPVFECAPQQRRGNLVADIGLLARTVPLRFVHFSSGIRTMLETEASGSRPA